MSARPWTIEANRLYRVFVSGFDFLKVASNIKEARRWAARAFPGESICVRREDGRTYYCVKP